MTTGALASVPTEIHSQTTAGETSPPSRTAWGDPDLQGVWDFRTITPMERPTELAGRDVLTDEEAAEFAQETLDSRDHDRAPREGNTGTYNQFWWDYGTKLTDDNRTSLIIDPRDGTFPPLTPAAQEKQAATDEARRDVGGDEPTPGGWLEDLGPGGLRVRCILGFNSGPPMTLGAYNNNNVQLVQTPAHVAILNEMNHNARIVPLDGRPHLGPHLRQWVGDSRGHWDGDTLVVETTNFLRETVVFRGQTSANLHLVERFTRVDADTLLYEVTVDDPTTWTRPWTYAVPVKTNSEPIYEYACYEGNYAMETILAGARAKEQAAEEAGTPQ